jgi:hypothetical protein
MCVKLNGVQMYVKWKHPLAVYVHCNTHSLNLAISEACSVASIRNFMAIVVNRFLNSFFSAYYVKYKWVIIFNIVMLKLI